ncbi:MAG: response regulator [Sulfurimonas sp.]|nr:response regulator [Sulfurimonadaceae bacterium]
MKILIIENEVYLAQSIAAKLNELGHNCELCTSTKDAIKSSSYDVVLLSTNINGQDFIPVVENFKRSIVILMVSYISSDTVSKPLAAGAKDYILKPFMIEELIRKINHYQDYEKLKKKCDAYEKYLSHTLTPTNKLANLQNPELPIYISSHYQKHSDAFAYSYIIAKDMAVDFVSLLDEDALEQVEQSLRTNVLIYITDYQILKKSDKKVLNDLVANRQVIISSTDKIDESSLNIVEIKNDSNIFAQGEILSIEDYIKFVVLNYQNKLPDTELSKKLGISRKSLWEKRKKFDILKTK